MESGVGWEYVSVSSFFASVFESFLHFQKYTFIYVCVNGYVCTYICVSLRGRRCRRLVKHHINRIGGRGGYLHGTWSEKM